MIWCDMEKNTDKHKLNLRGCVKTTKWNSLLFILCGSEFWLWVSSSSKNKMSESEKGHNAWWFCHMVERATKGDTISETHHSLTGWQYYFVCVPYVTIFCHYHNEKHENRRSNLGWRNNSDGAWPCCQPCQCVSWVHSLNTVHYLSPTPTRLPTISTYQTSPLLSSIFTSHLPIS